MNEYDIEEILFVIMVLVTISFVRIIIILAVQTYKKIKKEKNMNEIKVGEYIRDEEGFFTKIKKLIAVNNKGTIFCDCEDGNLYNKKYITKHSPNIIDLIEVGDYVNGCSIVEISKDPFIKEQTNLWTNMLFSEGEPFPNEYYKVKILEKDIKSIVTKEQFKEVEYKVC